MNRVDIFEGVATIFRDVFDDPALEIQGDMSARDIAGWDSVAMINIIVAVEEHFQIRLRTREVDGLKTIGDLIEAITKK